MLYLVAYAEKRGLPREHVIGYFGIDAEALHDVDGRVPFETYARMWSELPGLVGDADMPLHVFAQAETMEPPLNVLLFLASPTLGEGLRRLARYQRITFDLGDGHVSDMLEEDALTHLVVHPEKSALVLPTGAVIDACLGILGLSRMATGAPISPVALSFRHRRPRAVGLYEAAFGCPVTFGCAQDRMTFDTSDLCRPHSHASRTLLTITERYADALLSSFPDDDSFSSAVRREIRAGLPDGDASASRVADRLGIGTRTLQRRLEEEGASIRALIDDERRARALKLIDDPGTSLVDIAFALGFSDQSSFTRAFTRWTSVPPSVYRRTRRAPPT